MGTTIRTLRTLFMALLGAAGVAYIIYLAQAQAGRDRPVTQASPAHAPGAAERMAREGDGAGPIRIGWTAWTDAEVMTHLAERILEDRMGYEVELVMADIGIQYQGVATGDLDVMLMAWLPVTHQNYWDRVSGAVVDLGPLYTGARLGWVVPAYVPEEELGSLADLRKASVKRRLGHKIQGIDPGSGLMQASEAALDVYGIEGVEIVSSSGAAMTAALGRAIRRDRWIVVTAWNPHWMFARWDLRYLDDPEGVFGGKERVHALVRQDFYQDYPAEVTGFLARMYVPLDELEAALLEATRSSVDRAVDRYLESHPDRVDYWVTGELPAQ